MIECFLHGHGSCGGKLSREHYISKTVLDAIGHNGVQVGGLAWQPNQTLQRIGIGSLVSKVLCETHNSGLTTLDREAGDLFRVLDAADKRRTSLPNITTFDGPDVERWFLKVICGLAAGPGLSNGTVPDVWKSVLSGNPWPDGWGLYLPLPLGANVLATEFSVETLVDPASMVVLAVRFRVAGIHFNLLLCRLDSPRHGAYIGRMA